MIGLGELRVRREKNEWGLRLVLFALGDLRVIVGIKVIRKFPITLEIGIDITNEL